ncbi:MAG: serine protease Do [Acidimicrobiaceae bacterium]|jgi:serine protease Do
MTVLEELSSAAAGVVAQVGPAVVRIGRGGGRGCGVVLSAGIVATNAHNLRGEEVLVTFADGRQAVGTVAATDVDGDLAVLRVDTGEAPPITWSDGGPGVGQVVFAVTRSGAGGERVSFGMVSGTERAFRGPRGRRIKGSLEHTAPLPRGSSGSPVVTADGAVVGINTNRLGDGFYLALPADSELQARLASLSAGESRTRPRLGVGLAPAHVASALRRSVGLDPRDGLLVRVVEEGSPAESAGIRQGDLIVAVNGTAVTTADDLFDAMDTGGGDLQVKVVRGTDEVDITVRLEPTG